MTDDNTKAALTDAIMTRRYKDYFLTIDCDSEGASCKAVAAGAVGTLFDVKPSPAPHAGLGLFDRFLPPFRVPRLHRIGVPIELSRPCVHIELYMERFGTVPFMAIEMTTQSRIYVLDADFRKSEKRPYYAGTYNFQHNLESFFCLLLWMLLDRTPSTPSSRWFAETIFTKNDLNERRRVLTSPGHLREMLSRDLPDGYAERGFNFGSYAKPYRFGRMVLLECQEIAMNSTPVSPVHRKDSAPEPARQTRNAGRKCGREDDAYDPDEES
ncbi:hypothetical protein OE88DRAFT_1740024 [Heliocybe sulcata]|uniref:Fungal-type protein kinase domain-containing protein n=1 Tax=Heliocybe sulcata TaxID=5364 RepID=A0A5C3MK17_9AGAM|nr:hypothetical protein OE88DRAFT_1740024 [Heliocybe sulcata]